VYIARAFAHQAEFFLAVAQVAGNLPPQIVSVMPTLGTDWEGEPAVFFQVILADGADPAELLRATQRFSRALVQDLLPLEEWGVLPYFNYSTLSAQARVNEPTCA
jgi:hypothetical protein